MKNILFGLLVSVAVIGCEEKEPTCMVCFTDGYEVVDICLEDYPNYESIYDLREVIDPIFVNEECEYYN